MTEDSGRVPSEPGSREPSPDGLGPSGFDPSRFSFAILTQPEQLGVIGANGEVSWADGASPEKIMSHPHLPERIATLALWYATHRDSDGSPKGGDGEAGSVACDDSAGLEEASPESNQP